MGKSYKVIVDSFLYLPFNLSNPKQYFSVILGVGRNQYPFSRSTLFLSSLSLESRS
jgi:hypothetical protein